MTAYKKKLFEVQERTEVEPKQRGDKAPHRWRDRQTVWRQRVEAFREVLSIPSNLLVWLMLVTGIILSGTASYIVWSGERSKIQERFHEKADDVAIALQTTINDQFSVLEELSDFYGASARVERWAFRQLVKRPLSKKLAIQTMAWLPRVTASQKQEFEASIRAEGYPKFQITELTPQGSRIEAEKRPEYFPITYLESMLRQEIGLGLNFGSGKTGLALQKARDTGNVTLQMHLPALIDSDRQLAFAAVLPIYDRNAPYASLEVRRESLQGFVLGVFQLAEIVKEAFNRQDSDDLILINTTNIAFYRAHKSRTVNSNDHAFAFYDARTRVMTADPQTIEPSQTFLCRRVEVCTRTLQVGDEQWLVQFLPKPEYIAAQPLSKLWTTLIVGLSITGIVAACLLIPLERTRRIEQLLQERSRSNGELRQLNAQLSQANAEITLLGKMIDVLQACLTLEEAYAAIRKLMRQLFPTESGILFTINASGTLLETVTSWGDRCTSQLMFAPNDCWALRSSRVHLFENPAIDLCCPHCNQGIADKTDKSMCVSLTAQRETLGLLYLSSSQETLTVEKQQLAVTVADHVALALANLKLRETLKNQSIRDALTGLYNRRYLEEFLGRELLLAQSREQPLGIVMIDVDYFKRFNDTFGHHAGDAVLQQLGQLLLNTIRTSDIACRYGGEELMLIMPEASLEETWQQAEKIRQRVKHLNVEYRGQPLGAIAVSCGVACFPEHGLTGDAVIREADKALYRAKKEGRDCVVSASDKLFPV